MTVSIALTLLLLGLVLLVLALRMRQSTGLPWVPVIYRDTDRVEVDEPLLARRLGLVGKPDYLIEIGQQVVPVEVKPGRFAPTPYESDLMQLAAYCVLVEEVYGDPPPYGLLRYAERTFRMNYSPAVRAQVEQLLDEMRALLEAPESQRSHNDAARCAACGFLNVCDEALP